MFVAIMGTTISPYLCCWQAAQNAEQDQHLLGKVGDRPRRAVGRELRTARRDVYSGMFVSNVIMYFIMLTAGATLHPAGITEIQTADQAAQAMRPVAGSAAALLFAAGIIGTECSAYRFWPDPRPTLSPKPLRGAAEWTSTRGRRPTSTA